MTTYRVVEFGRKAGNRRATLRDLERFAEECRMQGADGDAEISGLGMVSLRVTLPVKK